MFFNRKKQEEFFQKLEEHFRFSKNAFQKMEEKIRLLENNLQKSENITVDKNNQVEIISQNVTNLQSTIQKHDMAIEDLLDEWEERRSDEEIVQKQISDCQKNEKQLLALFEAYQEQFFNLKRFADTKDSTWAEQIALMEQTLEHYRKLCGIVMIEECDIAVDYDLHEVIEAVSTTAPSKDKTVAAIYRCGYLYKGEIKRKAQVSAYRLEEKTL